jgi:hypothetical protein
MASGKGVKRRYVQKERISLDGLPRTCGSFFLDSGAHSLYNEHVLGKPEKKRYTYYIKENGLLTKEFREYLDKYAEFVRKCGRGLDFYVTVDAIYNPEISWKSYRYLVDTYGIKPVPVIHHRTPLRWIGQYIREGCDFIGLGGLGQESTKESYTDWGDAVYDMLCSRSKERLPCVRTHGFAMTSYDLLLRYPWYSVDSASWAKAAGVGTVYVPHYRNGCCTFAVAPYSVTFNWRPDDGISKTSDKKSFAALTPMARDIVCRWLEEINGPLGSIDDQGNCLEYGVVSQYNARAIANLRFFERLCQWLPEWPWPFKMTPRKGFFDQ